MYIGDADLGGYNCHRFDIPILMEEFARAGLDFTLENRRVIDAQTIFYKMEPRNLRAAYRYYTGNIMENAHNALADVRATVDVFKGQIERYEGKMITDEEGNTFKSPVKNDIQAIHEYITDPYKVDTTNRFRRDVDGTVLFNFGKYMGEPALHHEKYLRWIIDSEFSAEVKNICKQLIKEIRQTRKSE